MKINHFLKYVNLFCSIHQLVYVTYVHNISQSPFKCYMDITMMIHFNVIFVMQHWEIFLYCCYLILTSKTGT